ncbi:lipid phosphate phosphatase delta [Ziziphus jujuba]|uniref:Lipid phosphate phosphatase delta n=1 Tax=Ziziphus jujuba TaxID=326968 RepID=A0A6P4ATJ4_ZIZJJ|nr:lipid phosphate phosphatase delta [Ziziphus jujuba]XP_024922540.1 lipid phosphate phosphatase delta [Ziziphus jujuba]XP_048321013.1 lipid phosphate phosphatase delta-like [Ziziphus jujuba var. spinosa]XP_048321014.1 lipid phosphate phosphatase delta-like [Ziziphus jujuba var. spinosa]
MESIAAWQTATLCGIVLWIIIASYLNVTQKLRSLLQPWVTRLVIAGTPFILQIQNYQHKFLDGLFSGLSCVVSVPFYTAFLPLLFWSGHGKLARQMTLLMAFCDYLGNVIKDVVSAPRPKSPPVRRITATKDEEDNALEYGLPSSHTLNTVCLSGFLLHYVLSYSQHEEPSLKFAGVSLVCLFVGLIGLGRIYLGMHSVVDIVGGLAFGMVILAFWLTVHPKIDEFVVSGQSVTTFWAALSLLLLFAYPTPEWPTPSFEYHTAFNGVALGIVSGVQQTYHQFHHEAVPRIFTPQLSIPAFLGRMLVGIPTILLVKFCSKALAKWVLPVISNTLGIPIRSTSYVPALSASNNGKKSAEFKQAGYLQKFFFFSKQESFDVDTGIRFIQYAGLAWSVVDLVPSIFSYLRL